MFSDPVTILAATEPLEPQTTTSTQDKLVSVLEWSMDDNKGATILEYEIKIQNSALDMVTTESCNGQDPQVIDTR